MKPRTRRLWTALGLALTLAACTAPVRPAPERATPAARVDASLAQPDTGAGLAAFTDGQCIACHGAQAQGGIGPSLARTALPFEDFLVKVRTALPPKPAYAATELSDQATWDIYGWLQSLGTLTQAEPLPAFEVVRIAPGQEELPEGPILGMSVWTGFRCDSCHGAFGQGGPDGPALAGLSFPYEMERALMRETAGTIPEHAQTFMRDTVLKRLYTWLQEGADPQGGC